ncbi:MAG: LLM class oxidoreductase, partial [Saprospiraceae bacterium]|nr:LLM class oxidoreductase [Saprospiraceae bacterium]
MPPIFERINAGFNTVFQQGKLSLGLVIPIEEYGQGTVPTMESHLERVQLAETLGFRAVWVRDVPAHVPSFGDAGQTYDPFTYLGYLTAQTSTIALGVASIALPLHHPLHVAKSAATIDQLSSGRLILGVASGDRFEEYPAMNSEYKGRGLAFRDAYHYIRKAQQDFPVMERSSFGHLDGKLDILPKPFGSKIPMLITGHSQQDLAWIAEHGDGWMYYPRNLYMQQQNIKDWRAKIPLRQKINKPFLQPLYIDLLHDDDAKPVGIHLGIRTGINYLLDYFHQLQEIGVNHVAINLRFN